MEMGIPTLRQACTPTLAEQPLEGEILALTRKACDLIDLQTNLAQAQNLPATQQAMQTRRL
jgi:hypothetical protein